MYCCPARPAMATVVAANSDLIAKNALQVGLKDARIAALEEACRRQDAAGTPARTVRLRTLSPVADQMGWTGSIAHTASATASGPGRGGC